MRSYQDFGNFSPDGKEFIVKKPDTSRPWLNYFSNECYGICFSQTGSGFSIYKMPTGHKISYYSRDNQLGKCVYLRDNETGKYWSIGWLPVKAPYENFECCHGLGYSIIKFISYGIEAYLRVFIPKEDPVEIWTITVINKSNRKRNLCIFPFIEWYLQSYALPWDTYIWYIKAFFSQKENAIIATLNDALHTDKTYQAFMKPDFKIKEYECKRGNFLGSCQTLEHPKVVVEGKCTNSNGINEEVIGVFKKQVILKPNAKKTFNLVIGFSIKQHQKKRKKILKKYDTFSKIEQSFFKIKTFWQEVIDKNIVETPDKELNLWINIRLKYQLYQTYRWCRGVGAWQAVAIGFRDALQDAMGMAYLKPDLTKKTLFNVLKYQYKNGFAVRQYSEIGQHDFRPYSDSPIWIIYTLTSYLKETGDKAILEKEVAFLDGGKAPVLEHAKRALYYLYQQRGKHGLCLMNYGDWNDGLSLTGKKGKGESVWLTMALLFGLKQMKELMIYLGEEKSAKKYDLWAKELNQNLLKHCWDGQWFIRAYDDDYEMVGSKKCKEGKIYMKPQTWAVISGLSDKDKVKMAMHSVKEKLETPFGYISHTPGYQGYHKSIGNLAVLYPKQWVYIHNNSFKFAADLIAGNGDEAFRTLKKVLPTNPILPISGEPYVLPNFYSVDKTDPDKYGKSLYAWFSGSIAWFFKYSIEYMFGAKSGYEGLNIDPCLPSHWEKCKIIRTYRGAKYEITIKNPQKVQKGIKEITVDGKKQLSNIIKPQKVGKHCQIEVIMG